ncbi:hypothetical protein QTO34_008203 [Cnephaeus nilssonii]|uniref:Uncharacterized protein n=1 Tax=Cnephaeus nilssonii TaxID=3371016 RepID=A0AA40I9U7_CNENI|nr:hypothetical protein QTO34_008203 [Eptesicus nilssonii]
MFLSLPTLTVLIPLISLAGLFYSASVDENFPQGCTSTASLGDQGSHRHLHLLLALAPSALHCQRVGAVAVRAELLADRGLECGGKTLDHLLGFLLPKLPSKPRVAYWELSQ